MKNDGILVAPGDNERALEVLLARLPILHRFRSDLRELVKRWDRGLPGAEGAFMSLLQEAFDANGSGPG